MKPSLLLTALALTLVSCDDRKPPSATEEMEKAGEDAKATLADASKKLAGDARAATDKALEEARAKTDKAAAGIREKTADALQEGAEKAAEEAKKLREGATPGQ